MNPNSEEYISLNTIKVNIPSLRLQIIELMRDGFEEIPLGDLLFIIWSDSTTLRNAPSKNSSEYTTHNGSYSNH
jgi:hypothetical protein